MNDRGGASRVLEQLRRVLTSPQERVSVSRWTKLLRPAVLVGLASIGAACVLATTAGGTSALANCSARQLRLSGGLSGATQSLLGTLTLTNRSGRACTLPARPRPVSIYMTGQLLPTLTVRMRASAAPPGIPTRTLPAHGHDAVGVQWRNWCGAPRGRVRATLVLTIYSGVTPRLPLGVVTTPPCGDAKYSSTIAVSRFLRR
jgi:Protein of unknown function (DUF4232)